MFMGSEMRSRNALPKSEEQVSNEETLKGQETRRLQYGRLARAARHLRCRVC